MTPPKKEKDKREFFRREEDANNAKAASKVPLLEQRVSALEQKVNALDTKLDTYHTQNTGALKSISGKMDTMMTLNVDQKSILDDFVHLKRALKWVVGAVVTILPVFELARMLHWIS